MIRLLNATTLEFELFSDTETIKYVALSHRWRDEEVKFEDMGTPRALLKKGHQKIKACCRIAAADGIPYVWVDTCCIDKRSSAELSEAINSMFKWYQDSIECYAYLDDVVLEDKIRDSTWFFRCWTLQELIAPKKVTFFKQDWTAFGTKRSLRQEIAEITRIPERVLKGHRFSAYSVAQRMSWAADRKCTQIEDEAYSLLGLFDVNLPLIYGEGRKAFRRLQEEIIKQCEDQSILAWNSQEDGHQGLLASSPAMFAECNDIIETTSPAILGWKPRYQSRPWTMTSRGLFLQVIFYKDLITMDTFLTPLNCARESQPEHRLAIFLRLLHAHGSNNFARVGVGGLDIASVEDRMRISMTTPLDIYAIQNQDVLRQLPKSELGFKVISHIPFSHKSSHSSDDDRNFFAMPVGTFGHTITLCFNDARTNLGLLMLGFDNNFHPTCVVTDRKFAELFAKDLQLDKYDELLQQMDQSSIKAALLLWQVAYKTGIWSLTAPAERLDVFNIRYKTMLDNEFFSEFVESVPHSVEPFLSVHIQELSVIIRLNKAPVDDMLTWILQVMPLSASKDHFATISADDTKVLDAEAVESQVTSSKIQSGTAQQHGDVNKTSVTLKIKPNTESIWGDWVGVLLGHRPPEFTHPTPEMEAMLKSREYWEHYLSNIESKTS